MEERLLPRVKETLPHIYLFGVGRKFGHEEEWVLNDWMRQGFLMWNSGDIVLCLGDGRSKDISREMTWCIILSDGPRLRIIW